MKRTPLERKTPLRRSSRLERPIDRAAHQALRGTKGPRTQPKGGKRSSSWTRHARSMPCAVCGGRATQGHHIITQQELRHAAADNPNLWLSKIRWDKRNLLAVCNDCHANHHSRSRAIHRSVLVTHAPEVFEFAREIGRLYWLERTYPGGES